VRIYNPFIPARGPVLSEDVDNIAVYSYRRYFRNVKEKTLNWRKKLRFLGVSCGGGQNGKKVAFRWWGRYNKMSGRKVFLPMLDRIGGVMLWG
jgi:hypothetical protein